MQLIYQPASRYWEIQDIEAVCLVVVAVALLGLAWWSVTRRANAG